MISMKKIALVVHGGAGPDSDYIKQHQEEYKAGIAAAIEAGYTILENGGTAVEAVEAAVKSLEDNVHFNAGKGAALNANAEVEMCASIMQGQDKRSGAVAIIKHIRNPVSLARAVMEKTKHIYLGSTGALKFAQQIKMQMEPASYFITQYQYSMYEEKRKELGEEWDGIALESVNDESHGTVGAVALDKWGNIAAATSTRGTEYCNEGRIADSSMIGIGAYADNNTCAVSTTGDGEYHIKNVSAFQIAALMEYKGLSLAEACHYFIHEKCKNEKGDMGLIALDKNGHIALEFNSERMHRGWRTTNQQLAIKIYKE